MALIVLYQGVMFEIRYSCKLMANISTFITLFIIAGSTFFWMVSKTRNTSVEMTEILQVLFGNSALIHS